MPVKIHNKDYYTVAERVKSFREMDQEYQLSTELVSNTNYVVMKATISDNQNNVISTGFAEEERGSTNINTTSALENAETSAVGRALAFFGLAGTEIASADEVANAISQQAEKKAFAKAAETMQATLANLESVLGIKGYIEEGNHSAVAESWAELNDAVKSALWVAPSKGGPFTTKEREYFKSNEYSEARTTMFGETENARSE